MITINSLYLQPSPHPAPMFTLKPRPVGGVHATGTVRPRATSSDSARSSSGTRAQPEIIATTPGRDAIGALIATSSNRVLAIQKALADFGYGAVKPTGIFGPDTRAAIEKFERDRKLPVMGQLSERVVRELSAVTGRPID
jgi:peptidoglycan hydrolase-like protein with peptidoglycan-binding domain